MKPTLLTRERLLQVLEYCPSTGRFAWRNPLSPRNRAGYAAGTLHKATGYRRLMVDGRRYQEHQLVWLAETGEFPPTYIDHINGRRADNRFGNLRLATQQQNNENVGRRSDNRSGLRGVSRRVNGSWVAQIQSAGVKHHLGYFDTPEAAHAAYTLAATNLFTHYANR